MSEKRVSQMDVSLFKDWLARERKSVEHMIDFWDNQRDEGMVSYEFARLDEIKIIESVIDELE